MKFCELNYPAILGNFLVSFCITAMAVSLVGAGSDAVVAGFISAVLAGILSIGKELQAEAGEGGTTNYPTLLKNLTLF